MGMMDAVTGKRALERMEATAAEMERVYTAFATRMVEILDKEERLRGTAARLEDGLQGLVALEREQGQSRLVLAEMDRWQRRQRWLTVVALALAVLSLVTALVR